MTHSTPNPFAQTILADVIKQCQQERGRFRRNGDPYSPACMELFRRAFDANDQEALQAIQTTFNPQIKGWIGVQSRLETEDVLQEVWLQIWRYVPRKPELLGYQELSPLLTYIKTITKTMILMMLRHEKNETEPLDNRLAAETAHDDIELRPVIVERLATLLKTDLERKVFLWRFVCELSPQQIMELYGSNFRDIKELYNVIQRITRRLREDDTLRGLHGGSTPSSLKPDSGAFLISDIKADGMNPPNDEPCELNDAYLLDYITGVASAEIRERIERSPACMQAAQALTADIGKLLPVLRRLTCPDIITLVTYQERRLTGSQFLVVNRHVVDCPLCTQELELLRAIDAVPMTDTPGIVRRVIEAIFQPPLQMPQPVRGNMLHYKTPDLQIQLVLRKVPGKMGLWQLRGQIRALDGNPVSSQLKQVVLQSADQSTEPFYEATVEETGSFVFRDLLEGNYKLTVFTSEEETFIRSLIIGEET